MKKLIVFIFSVLLLGSCSSEKTLSEQIKYDWDINYNLSKNDFNERPYNPIKNLKNSSVQNQSEVQAILPSVKNNQDFLASKDKVKPSVLKNYYSYKKLPQIIQYEKINKSLLEKVQILDKKSSSLKASKTKAKKNKILWIIGTSLMISLTFITSFITGIVLAFDGLFNEAGLSLSLLSTLFIYLSYKSVKKTVKAFSSDNNKNDIKDSID